MKARFVFLLIILLGAAFSFVFPELWVLSIFLSIFCGVIVNYITNEEFRTISNVDLIQLRHRSSIGSLFKEEKTMETLINSSDKALEKILRGKALDKKFIDDTLPEFNAAIQIALQKSDLSFKLSNSLTYSDFKSNAIKAAKYLPYKNLLLSNSLKGIGFNNEKVVTDLLVNSKLVIDGDLKSIADEEFSDKLNTTSSDTLVVFSTTSQLSSDIIKDVDCFTDKVKKIEFYLCSPFIISDSAIEELKKEYSPHNVCIPPRQFIKSKTNDHIDIEIDSMRRVLRILSSIHKLKKFSDKQGVDVDVHFFKQCYPGIKIKMLESLKFMQVQPGPLSFANNTYRFGVATTDGEICDQVRSAITKYKNDPTKIESMNISSEDINAFERRVLKELTIWLSGNGVDSKRIREQREFISQRVMNEHTLGWIEQVTDMLDASILTVKAFNILNNESLTNVLSSGSENGIYSESLNNEKVHKTVALLIVNDDEVLLIEKSDQFYDSKYSVVAGHINNNETIKDALIREVNEEISLNITTPNFLIPIKGVNEACRYGVHLHDWYVFIHYIDDKEIEFELDKEEIKSTKWVKLSELESMKDDLTLGCRALFENIGYIK